MLVRDVGWLNWIGVSLLIFLVIYYFFHYFFKKEFSFVWGGIGLVLSGGVIAAAILSLPPSEGVWFGAIEGSLSYPSESIPNMQVCAENVQTNQSFCTAENIESDVYKSGKGYKLKVPVGEYYVFAVNTQSDAGFTVTGYKAYYSDYVLCTQQGASGADCPSHAPIVISVKKNTTTSGVDPQDWYALD